MRKAECSVQSLPILIRTLVPNASTHRILEIDVLHCWKVSVYITLKSNKDFIKIEKIELI